MDSCSEREKLVITESGKSGYSIAVSKGARAPERFAAEELQRYIGLISGVKIPIVSDSASETVFLVGDMDGMSSGCARSLGEDAYTVKTLGEKIVLRGGSPRATLYAVYHLLEKHLGCGFCVPGDDTVPARDSIVIDDIDDEEEPVFKHRAMLNFPFEPERALKEIDWFAKNRINWAHPGPNGPEPWEKYDARKTVMPAYVARGLRIIWGGHTFLTWVPAGKYYEEHPEYFALIGGERKKAELFSGALCVSNPEVAKVVAESIIEFLRKNPEIEAVDLWMNDTRDWCECDECNALEGKNDYTRFEKVFNAGGKAPSRSRAYFTFVNRVARLVKKHNSRVMISALAYACCNEPADLEIEENVLVGFAPILRSWQEPLTKKGILENEACNGAIRSWKEKTRNFFVYEYYNHYDSNPLSDIPITITRMAEELRYYLSLGIDKISNEDVGWRQLAAYAYARLVWDPSLETEGIINDFCNRYYGSAAPVMKEFWSLQEEKDDWETRKKKGLDTLCRAKKKAGSEQVMGRIAILEEIFNLGRNARWGRDTRF